MQLVKTLLRTAQPQQFPSVRREFFDNLQICFHAPTGQDVIGARQPTITPAAGMFLEGGEGGVGWNYSGTTLQGSYPSVLFLQYATRLTVSFVAKRTSGSTAFSPISAWNGTYNANPMFIISLEADGSVMFGVYRSNTEVRVRKTVTGLIQAGKTYSITVQWEGAYNAIYCSVNGIDYPLNTEVWSAGSVGQLAYYPQPITLCANTGANSAGVLYHAAMWVDRNPDRIALSANPWQIYSGDRKYIRSQSAIMRRAIYLSSGQLAQVPTAQLGTGKKPLVIMSDGTLKERATTEGTPLVLVNGVLRGLAATGETLEI